MWHNWMQSQCHTKCPQGPESDDQQSFPHFTLSLSHSLPAHLRCPNVKEESHFFCYQTAVVVLKNMLQ